jgi:hypothetical protein
MRLDDEATPRSQGEARGPRAKAPALMREPAKAQGKPASGGALGDALMAAMRASKTGAK